MSEDMKAYIANFLEEFDYPQESREVLLSTYDRVVEDAELKAVFDRYILEYAQNDTIIWNIAADEITACTQKNGLPNYTVHLLFYICQTPHAKALYEKQGLSMQIYKDTFMDFKYKLFECHDRHGIWGNQELKHWNGRFFDLTRFALGRLQFETREFMAETEYVKDGRCVKPGDLVVNIHIPSGGPLTEAEVRDSLAQAHAFYKHLFPDQVTIFVCRSWMLCPAHREFLPEKSNIRKFMDLFDIFHFREDKLFRDWWRIFYMEYNNNPDEMPRKTGLQRAYVNMVKAGHIPGMGFGILFYQ